MLPFPQPVSLTRIDHQFGGDAALLQRGEIFLGLPQGRATVVAALDQQRRRRRPVEPGQRGAFERDLAVALVLERPAIDEFMEIVFARIVAAELVGNGGDRNGRLEAVGCRHRPIGQVTAIAGPGNADPVRIGQAQFDAFVDAGHDVGKFHARRIAQFMRVKAWPQPTLPR